MALEHDGLTLRIAMQDHREMRRQRTSLAGDDERGEATRVNERCDFVLLGHPEDGLGVH